MFTKIETVDQLNDFLSENDKALIDFYADWCGPCKILDKTLQQIDEGRDDFVVGKVDVDNATELAQMFGIRGVPSVYFYSNGEVAETLVGAHPASVIVETYNGL